jgi:hypothetical protein
MPASQLTAFRSFVKQTYRSAERAESLAKKFEGPPAIRDIIKGSAAQPLAKEEITKLQKELKSRLPQFRTPLGTKIASGVSTWSDMVSMFGIVETKSKFDPIEKAIKKLPELLESEDIIDRERGLEILSKLQTISATKEVGAYEKIEPGQWARASFVKGQGYGRMGEAWLVRPLATPVVKLSGEGEKALSELTVLMSETGGKNQLKKDIMKEIDYLGREFSKLSTKLRQTYNLTEGK